MTSTRHRSGAAVCAIAIATVMPGAAFAGESEAPNYSGGLFERDGLTGDWGGARAALYEKGFTYQATFTGDASATVAGGVRRGEAFSRLLQIGASIDLDRAFGWTGGEVYADMHWLGGRGASAGEVGNLLTISSIEATPAIRLGEVYVRQALFDETLTIKVGQLAADGDFATSDTARLFVNSTFGWPGLNGADLPSGGPVYPVPTPGVHALVKLGDALSFHASLFEGDPAGENNVNRHNIGFPVDDGAFAIGELVYERKGALPGAYKLGAWRNSLKFEDLRSGTAHDGAYALYGVIDQTVWQGDGDRDDPTAGVRLVTAFARAVVTPQSDRNLIDHYVDAGFNAKGFVPGRDKDIFGIAAAYAHISKRARLADRDAGTPVHSSELAFEASYKARIAPWLALQPFAQYIVRPGGGDARLNDPDRRIRNATVLGLRSQASF